jgi:hypothetical protein
MPGPLSRPDGKKESQEERVRRGSGEKVIVTGRTAKKRQKRIRVEE